MTNISSLSPDLLAEMQALFPCENPTDEKQYAGRVELFQFRKLALLTGNAWRLDLSDEQLAFTILDDIVGLARDGDHEEAVKVAADAKTIVDGCQRSPTAWKTSATKAFKLLGHTKKRGQRSNKLAMSLAIAAFELYRNEKKSIADAERHAYDIYQFHLHERKDAYMADCKDMQYHGADWGVLTLVEYWMRHTFRPKLIKEGLMDRPQRGRKPKRSR